MANKSSVLPYVIVGGVVVAVGWHVLAKSRKVDPATSSSTDPEATTKPTAGGIVDGLVGGIRDLGATLGNLRDLFSGGGKESTDGSGQANNKRVTGAVDRYYAGGAVDRTLRKTRSRQMPGTQAPTWGSTWADRAAIGDYN